MAIRKHKTISGRWYIIISNGAKGKQDVYHFDGAEAEARIYEAEIRKTYHGPAVASTIPTLDELYNTWLTYYTTIALPSTVASVTRSWRQLCRTFGRVKPNYVTPILIQQYKQTRLTEGVSKRTINKELSYLASFIKWCESEESGPIIAPLPFKIKGFPGKQTRAPLPRVLTEDEIDRLLAAIPDYRQGLVAAMYYAGLRFSEAANLTTSDVDLAHNHLIIRGKGDKERIVPILPQLRPHLVERNDKSPGLLWPSPLTGKAYKNIQGLLNYASKRAGITKHVHPHLLRHTFGAHAIKNVPLRAMQLIMGHSTPVVTQRYTQIAAQTLSDALAAFRGSEQQPEKNHG